MKWEWSSIVASDQCFRTSSLWATKMLTAPLEAGCFRQPPRDKIAKRRWSLLIHMTNRILNFHSSRRVRFTTSKCKMLALSNRCFTEDRGTGDFAQTLPLFAALSKLRTKMYYCSDTSTKREDQSSKGAARLEVSRQVSTSHNLWLRSVARAAIPKGRKVRRCSMIELIQSRKMRQCNCNCNRNSMTMTSSLRTKWWVKSMWWATPTQRTCPQPPRIEKCLSKCTKTSNLASSRQSRTMVATTVVLAQLACSQV